MSVFSEDHPSCSTPGCDRGATISTPNGRRCGPCTPPEHTPSTGRQGVFTKIEQTLEEVEE